MNTKIIIALSATALTFGGGAYAVANTAAPKAITSSVTDELSSAVTAKYPGSTIVGIRSLSGGGYHVHVRTSDAKEVHVSLDAAYKITSTQEGRAGRGGGMGHGGPGHGGRGGGMDTAALAKAIGVSEDKLTAALEKVREAKMQEREQDRATRTTPPSRADRAAKHKELATALAKELGVSTDKVTKALEAQRPTKFR